MNILVNFIATFAIEFAVFCFFFRDYLKLAFFVLLINLFTWPIANLIYGFWSHLLIIELGVFVAEGFLIMLLFRIGWKKGFLISFAANLASALFGFFI